jgi:hypothetical protein
MSAAGPLQGSACSPTLVAGACSSAASEGAVGRQFLFSVYTHPAPGFSASPPLCSALPSPPENPLLEIIVWFYNTDRFDWHATVSRDRISGWGCRAL